MRHTLVIFHFFLKILLVKIFTSTEFISIVQMYLLTLWSCITVVGELIALCILAGGMWQTQNLFTIDLTSNISQLPNLFWIVFLDLGIAISIGYSNHLFGQKVNRHRHLRTKYS